MQVRRQVSPLLTLVLILGAVGVFRQSPWIRETQGWSAQPLAESAASAENVATLTPMIPPGFQGPARSGNSKTPTVAPAFQRPPLIKADSSLKLADPQVAQQAHITPQRRQEITQKVTALNARAEKVLQQAIQEWRRQGGVASQGVPDFQSAVSPQRREIESLARKTEREIAQMLSEEELSRWKAMNSAAEPAANSPAQTATEPPAPPMGLKPLSPALVD